MSYKNVGYPTRSWIATLLERRRMLVNKLTKIPTKPKIDGYRIRNDFMNAQCQCYLNANYLVVFSFGTLSQCAFRFTVLLQRRSFCGRPWNRRSRQGGGEQGFQSGRTFCCTCATKKPKLKCSSAGQLLCMKSERFLPFDSAMKYSVLFFHHESSPVSGISPLKDRTCFVSKSM